MTDLETKNTDTEQSTAKEAKQPDAAENIGKAILGGGLAELCESLCKASMETLKKAELAAMSEDDLRARTSSNPEQAERDKFISSLKEKLEKSDSKLS